MRLYAVRGYHYHASFLYGPADSWFRAVFGFAPVLRIGRRLEPELAPLRRFVTAHSRTPERQTGHQTEIGSETGCQIGLEPVAGLVVATDFAAAPAVAIDLVGPAAGLVQNSALTAAPVDLVVDPADPDQRLVPARQLAQPVVLYQTLELAVAQLHPFLKDLAFDSGLVLGSDPVNRRRQQIAYL